MSDGLIQYPWFFNDWLASPTRAMMSCEERGIYRDLLDYQAAHGHIPDNNEVIARMANASQSQCDRFMERWGDRLFPRSGDGTRANPKLAAVRVEILDLIQKRAIAGKVGAEKRWQTHGNRNGNRNGNRYSKPHGKTIANQSQSNTPHNPPKPPKPPGGAHAEYARTYPLAPHLQSPDVRAAWVDWINSRVLRGKTPTEVSLSRTAAKLAKVTAAQAVEALGKAADGDWSGVFPENQNGKNNGNRVSRVPAKPGKYSGLALRTDDADAPGEDAPGRNRSVG